MDTPRFFKPALILLAAGLATVALGTTAVAQQMGIWRQHQVSFNWLGDVSSGTFYSCEGLTEELTFLLKQSGAKLNAPVRILPCISTLDGPSTLLTAKLDFSTFMPIDNQPSGQSPTLPGSWRSVEFSEPHSYPNLHLADCELVLEFKDRLLKYFATRQMRANLRCIPFQAIQYALAFQTFVPTDSAARAVGGR